MIKPIAISQFLTQVKQETSKVTWSGRKEVIATTVMVLIVVLLVGLFFFGVDAVLFRLVQAILGF
jgi:preprotein translocase subunit SecE